MPELTKEEKLRLLSILLESRHGDLREQNLNHQGKGHFHVSGMGHEALAAISIQMQENDYIVPYYRDRALVLGRGVSSRQLSIDYFAKAKGESHGRQMPSHYSCAEKHIWSVPTPTGSQLLPACGMAWGIKLDGKNAAVVTTVGDAATRQGDFYEAICFAKEKKLPMLFVVEDNGYGISSPTRKINPRALDVVQPNDWRELDGADVGKIYEEAAKALAHIRAGNGPVFFWVMMERLSSHTSSDDQKLYRTADELKKCEECDPLRKWKERLIAEGLISESDYAKLDNEIKERVRREFSDAEKGEDQSADALFFQVTGKFPQLDDEILPPGKYRIGDTVNKTLRLGLERDKQRIIFGEDIEDPKGGVFRLTQKLSTEFPNQVFNSPLAESTILGVACGLASYGKRPVFELQFIDFIGPGWNQLATNICCLRWRSFGQWKCPMVIYAPYGAYLPGGSLWHSQANESALAHYPGLSVVIPSTPEDAAGLLWTAMQSEDPVIFLIPKHLLWAEHESQQPVRAVPFGQARKRSDGSDVTLVAWGNTIEKSVRKTGRLVVVQEDTENCSVGQMIISHLTSDAELWSTMISPPILVSKTNVMIGYNPIYEYAALPDVERIVAAIKKSVSTTYERAPVAAGADRGRVSARAGLEMPGSETPATVPESKIDISKRLAQSITVPIMGEGIRNAKIVSLLKNPGDPIALDDSLCEVETDKAVYPIESSFAGVMGEWKTKVGDTVDIGQELGTILTGEASFADQVQTAAKESGDGKKKTMKAAVSGGEPAAELDDRERHDRHHRIEPALSPTITRKLSRVIPANLQIDARWDAIQKARDVTKKKNGENAPSPSAMIAWAVVRAMEKHAPFRRLILEDDRIIENDDFDLGIAVALEGDRLATAVIAHANKKSWSEFVKIYNETVEATRGGRVDAMNASVVITSLGAFGVKAGAPIVVPPSVGTLFVGSAHREMIPNKNENESAEVITLSLTFDHRVVNGAGAASFANEIKKQIEGFKIPSEERPGTCAHKS